MRTPEERNAMRQVPLFDRLPEPALDKLLTDSISRRYKRGTLLFSQGEHADRFYVIVEGWVKLFRATQDGNEYLVGLFSRGQSFAEGAMFDKSSFPVNAAVTDDCQLLVFPAERFLRTLREDHDLALNLLGNLSRRLRSFVQHMEQLTTQPTYQRLAGFLVSLCPADEPRAVVELPCDKLLIAGRLGMKPESFSRAMARLRALNVQCEGNTVHIPNLPALRQFATCANSCLPPNGPTLPSTCGELSCFVRCGAPA
jgi:CRP/FNR family transcriptional regulator, dissimilatory nitrate respiration regulator